MKLVSIKAHGFKSFADTIDLELSDGITGIVGPNGSGKSNVVDAVRWVLGETSLKEIRSGDNISDVIFVGSSSRSAQSHAWVTLTFDNKDRYLNSPFDEIEVKREVYKTGENEYYINNSKVRKKDITDLFIDTSFNPDSFSIISQGKITDILKGKPSDRRSIIEEAAGVLKYKKRKEETMKKLDSTHDNLEKISLVINELEGNLAPLKEQSDIATKYLNYKNELESIEIGLIASDIKNLNDEYQDENNRLKIVSDELTNMTNSNSSDISKIEKLKNDSLKLDENISKVSSKIMELNSKLNELNASKKLLQEREKYEVDNQKLENNIIALKDSEIDIKKQINDVKNNIKNIQNILKSNKDNLDKLDSEYRDEIVRKNTLVDELNSKNKEELLNTNKIDILNNEIESMSKMPYAVRSVLNNPKLSGIHDALINLIDVDDTYSKSVSVSLGGNQNVIVVDNQIAGKKAIEYLKDNNLGRATFYPLNIIKGREMPENIIKDAKSVPGYIGILSDLISYNPVYKNIITKELGTTLVVDNINTMNKLGEKLDYKYRVVTLDGDILYTGGAMSGGRNKSDNSIINSKIELSNLEKRNISLKKEIDALNKDINEREKNVQILEDKLFKFKSKNTEDQEVLNSNMRELNSLNDKLDSIEEEIKGTNNLINNDTSKELDKVLNEYLNTSNEYSEYQNKLNEYKNKKNDLQTEIEEMEIANRKANSEYNKKLNENKELEISIGKLDVKLDNLLNKLSEEYNITYEKAIRDNSLDMDIDTARNKVNKLRKDIKELGEVNIGSIDEYKRFNERYTYLTGQKSDIENAINDLLEVINDLDETMKERFSDTFTKVNNEFENVFRSLFKGGHAKLILTDPSDMLETGVDITACPPGKSLKNINSLSGGENTLTAIALLFSILNVKTVPFVILDEVEAALDENNVDTFGTYLQKYKGNTQFVIITHKKKTMEYANTLYGITMQESGVSKIVSVKLENI